MRIILIRIVGAVIPVLLIVLAVHILDQVLRRLLSSPHRDAHPGIRGLLDQPKSEK